MDCEMVGVTSQGNKSALGRVTLVNKWGNFIYDEFVRPVERVVDFRTQISGIRPRDMKKAKDFRDVQKKVADLIKGKILVGHALRNDLKVCISYPLFLEQENTPYLFILLQSYLETMVISFWHDVAGGKGLSKNDKALFIDTNLTLMNNLQLLIPSNFYFLG